MLTPQPWRPERSASSCCVRQAPGRGGCAVQQGHYDRSQRIPSGQGKGRRTQQCPLPALRSQSSSLRVRLQRAALVPGQKISQPVQNCAQRQAGGSVLIPVAPACTAAKVTFHCDLCAGAGILRDGTDIICTGTLPQLLYKALGAGGIQPILPAVGAEVGLAQQAVGTGRKTPGQLPIRIVAQLPALRNSWKFRQRRPMVE